MRCSRVPLDTNHSFTHTFNVIWLAPLHKKGGSKLWEVTLQSHSSKCKTYTPHVHFVCLVQCALRNVLIWLCSVQRYCVQMHCVRRCCVQRCSRFVKHVRTTRGSAASPSRLAAALGGNGGMGGGIQIYNYLAKSHLWGVMYDSVYFNDIMYYKQSDRAGTSLMA